MMGMQSKCIGPGRSSSGKARGTGHGPMFGRPEEALHFGLFPDGGGYPLGFVEWAFDKMASVHWKVDFDPARVLHLCSGSVTTGVRVDIRPSVLPDVVSDCRSTPFPDESFDFIMADPPYSPEYAQNLYGTGKDYPKPMQILTEATRLLRPGGVVGLMHHQVPVFRKPLKLHKVYAVHRGLGFSLVAWSLFQKGSE